MWSNEKVSHLPKLCDSLEVEGRKNKKNIFIRKKREVKLNKANCATQSSSFFSEQKKFFFVAKKCKWRKTKFKNDKRKISIANCRPHSSQFLHRKWDRCEGKINLWNFMQTYKIFYAKPRKNFKQLNWLFELLMCFW